MVNDGDLLILIDRILELGEKDTVRVTQVKKHADEDMVLAGQGKELDRLGHDAAEEVWFLQYETVLCCLALLVFGPLTGLASSLPL